MAGIKAAIQDVLTKIATLDVTNADGQTVKALPRIWNNQTAKRKEGKMYDYPLPAFFVEIINPATYELIGQGYRAADIAFKVHIEHAYYTDAGDFTQDLKIYELRDAIIDLLQHYRPTGCGLLVAAVEEQDYDHDNVNEFSIDFLANFTDDVGKTKYIDHTITEVETPITKTFNIP